MITVPTKQNPNSPTCSSRSCCTFPKSRHLRDARLWRARPRWPATAKCCPEGLAAWFVWWEVGKRGTYVCGMDEMRANDWLTTTNRAGAHHEVDGCVGGGGVGGGHGDARPGEEARVPGPLFQEGDGVGALSHVRGLLVVWTCV